MAKLLSGDKLDEKVDSNRERAKSREKLIKRFEKAMKEVESERCNFVDVVSSYSNMSASISHLDTSIALWNDAALASRNKGLKNYLYMLKGTRNQLVHKRQEFLKGSSSDLSCYEKSVKGYGELINQKKAEEPELQAFFEKNPILLNQTLKKIIPKKSFGGENIPDFVAILHNDNHILIEIEKPSDKLYTIKGHPTAKFTQAEQQVRDYLQWASREQEFLRRRGLPNINVENTKGLLVIGMRADLSQREEEKLSQQNFSCRSSHEIKTFDDILKENLQIIDGIRKANK